MLNWPILACLAALTPGAGDPPPASAPTSAASGFIYKTIAFNDVTCAYCVYVPPDYTPDRAWPVILFLHGSGERGDDGFLQTDVGLGRALRRNYRAIPAIVVMPQCRPGETWAGEMGTLALRCVEAISHEYHLDAQRLYLTGLSLGGHGAWHLAARVPDRFAALIVICGFADLSDSDTEARQLAPQLKDIPILCFHGAQDANVPVQKTRAMVAAIRAAGGHIEYTEYKDGTHFIWDRVYENREVWKWLFEQRRTDR